jgi:hypothetical protein
MRHGKRLTVGPAPTAFSTEDDTTVVFLQNDTVTFAGDLDHRRRAAQAFAEAVGLSVVDTNHLLPQREAAEALAR